jgi:hypothetical protein
MSYSKNSYILSYEVAPSPLSTAWLLILTHLSIWAPVIFRKSKFSYGYAGARALGKLLHDEYGDS